MCPCWSSRVMYPIELLKDLVWQRLHFGECFTSTGDRNVAALGGTPAHISWTDAGPGVTPRLQGYGEILLSYAQKGRGSDYLQTTQWQSHFLNSFHFSFLSWKIWDNNSQLRGSCEHGWVVQSNLLHHTAWAGIPAPGLLVSPGWFSSPTSCPRFLIWNIILVPIITIIWLCCTACRILVS